MKTIFTLSIITAVALFSGCATGENGLALATVGPPSSQPMAASSNQGSLKGTLVVYSAYKVNADFNARDPNRPEYSDYEIFTTDGKLLQRVHNNSGTILQDAASVELPPGKYNVVARVNGHGYVTVPIMIAAQHNTVLHLEDGGFTPDESVSSQSSPVRLPDGQVIGWEIATTNLQPVK